MVWSLQVAVALNVLPGDVIVVNIFSFLVGRLVRPRLVGCLVFVKADFHSVQNVARSTLSERFLLNYKQSSGTNLISCGH